MTYLKKALDIEVYKLEDYSSTASTHLNICAIYSYLGRHDESANHAQLAVNLLSKIDVNNLKESQAEGQKSYWNIKMLAYYNLAIEQEHLKKYQQSRKHYKLAKQTAEHDQKKNNAMIKSIEESLKNIDTEETQNKKKLIELLARRKNMEEKGNHQFMRKNKKNFGNEGEWRSVFDAKKYDLYKTNQHDNKNQHQSSERVKRLNPINEGAISKRNLPRKQEN